MSGDSQISRFSTEYVDETRKAPSAFVERLPSEHGGGRAMTPFRDTKSVTKRPRRHRVCRVCGAPIEQPDTGRRRLYCSDVCRQRASRRRRRVKPYHMRQSDEWCTPSWLLRAALTAAGQEIFDLDPCSPVPDGPVPALNRYTALDDGLAHGWTGLVWCNPP